MVWAASSATGKLFFYRLDHDDATPLRVLFSVLALSLIERTPESMGEETVRSIRVGTESMATAAAESCVG